MHLAVDLPRLSPRRTLIVALVAAAVSVTATVGVLAVADYAYRVGYFNGQQRAALDHRGDASQAPTVVVIGELGERARERVTANAVFELAYQAFPAWAVDHPDATCPDSLRALFPYLERVDSFDPWGNLYRSSCTDGRLAVWSVGPDGVEGTADDVKGGRSDG